MSLSPIGLDRDCFPQCFHSGSGVSSSDFRLAPNECRLGVGRIFGGNFSHELARLFDLGVIPVAKTDIDQEFRLAQTTEWIRGIGSDCLLRGLEGSLKVALTAPDVGKRQPG